MDYTLYTNLAKEIEIPENGTISKTLYHDKVVKVVLFGFAAGQELSEHTASVPAVVHVLDGEIEMTLGKDRCSAFTNTWIHMPAKLPHSVTAKTDARMLLILFKSAQMKDSAGD